MRCCAHILNLIVRDGINEVSESICCIRGIVKYIRSSPSRASQFRACVDQAIGKVKGLIGRIMGALTTIFDHYQRLHSLGPSSSKNHSLGEIDKPVSLSPQGSRSDDDGDNVIDDEIEVEYKLHRQVRSGLGSKSEIDRYLEDEIEDQTPSFDILVWWKANSSKYRILSQVEKDVLAIPVSTVASESAFSTGGRVLDQFRSSLTPKIIQCLICTQDWLRASSQPIEVEEKLEDLQEIETSTSKS